MWTAGRLAGVVVVACLGCSFDAGGGNNDSGLGDDGSGSPTTGDSVVESTGADEAGSGSAEGTSVGGSTSVGSDEMCIDECIPQVPAGWLGPFYAAEAANEIGCPAGYDAQDVAYGNLEAAEAGCSCSCSAAAGSCAVAFEMSLGGCFGGATWTVGDGECESLPSAGLDVHAFATVSGSPGACTPNLQQDIAPTTWGTTTTFCAAPARGGSCGNDRCTAAPPDGVATLLCVSKNGQHDCPGLGYSERTVLHRSVADTRECTGCNCGGQAACDVQAFAHDNDSCNDEGQVVTLNGCTDLSISGSYGLSTVVQGGTCSATDATPAGEATPLEPVTVCCVE